MRAWKKIPLLILSLTLILSLAACSTVQSVIGSIGGKQDPSVAGNKPAGSNSAQEEDPSVAGNIPAGDHSGDTDPGPGPGQGGQQTGQQEQYGNVTWSLEGGTLTISGSGPMMGIIGIDPTNPERHAKHNTYWPWTESKSSITTVVIESGITSIESYAFSGCDSLPSITIPDSVTWIGEQAFANCDSLTSVTIPDSVTGTLDATFINCDNLTTVTIGSGVETLRSAFNHCPKLVSITINNNNRLTYDNLLYHADPAAYKELVENCTIYAPAGSPTEQVCKDWGLNFSPLG